MNAVLKKIVCSDEHYEEFAKVGSAAFWDSFNSQGFNHPWSMWSC